MLEIHPVETKEEQKKYCALCGAEFDADLLCYAAYVDGMVVGVTQFKIDKACGYIYDISNTLETNDENALFVMGRATLNFIDNCGIEKAEYIGKVTDEVLLKNIGYRKNSEGKWIVSLSGFFDSPCQHK